MIFNAQHFQKTPLYRQILSDLHSVPPQGFQSDLAARNIIQSHIQLVHATGWTFPIHPSFWFYLTPLNAQSILLFVVALIFLPSCFLDFAQNVHFLTTLFSALHSNSPLSIDAFCLSAPLIALWQSYLLRWTLIGVAACFFLWSCFHLFKRIKALKYQGMHPKHPRYPEYYRHIAHSFSH